MRNKKKLVQAYQLTFMSPEGQTVLKDLRRLSGFDRSIPCKDQLEMARMIGEANVIRYIFKVLNTDPNEVRPQATLNDINPPL